MTNSSYAFRLVLTVLAAASALAGGSILLQPLSGDQARIGRYDEADFGWQGTQTRFKEPLFQLDPARIDHDIVVLGDSFSNDASVSWQNHVAQQTGARIATFHIRNTRWDRLLQDPSYRASPPKVFVLEIVERDLKEALGTPPPSCEVLETSPHPRLPLSPVEAEVERYTRPTRRSLFQLDPREVLQFQWARLLRRFGRSSGEAVEVGLTRRAFSCRSEKSTLVYAGDILKRHWTPADLKNIGCQLRWIQDSVQRGGRTLFLVMLIPDKLTAYSPDLSDRALDGLGILSRLDTRGLNVLPVAQALGREIRAGTLDVYLPDDSHLGSLGQELLARTVFDELHRRGVLPSVPKRRLTSSRSLSE